MDCTSTPPKANDNQEVLDYLQSKYPLTVIQKGQGDMTKIVTDILHENKSDDPQVILDLAAVLDQYLLWQKNLPRVKVFFAMKACSESPVLDLLSKVNCGFDIASKNELKMIKKYGVKPENLIYTNPNKQISHMLEFKEAGIDRVTVDCVDELDKISEHFREARVFVRLKTTGKGSLYNLSTRFGCPSTEYEPIIKKAKSLNLNVVGVSFHVGYRSNCPDTFYESLESAMKVIEIAEQHGYEIKYVNIGGGFPGYDWDVDVWLPQIAEKINQGIDKILERYPNITFFGEPGRFMVARFMTLAVQVVGKKKATETACDFYYTITEGSYGMFRGSVPEEPNMQIRHFKKPGQKFMSKFFGPTCDSGDLVKTCEIEELNIGDWLYFINCGAYFHTCAGSFNGFTDRKEYMIWREDSLEGDHNRPKQEEIN